jgi:hypothetical protein
MSCPTCDHALQTLGYGHYGWAWCPRCGSLMVREADVISCVTPPALVDRVRRLRDLGVAGDGLTAEEVGLWRRLGILEAIATPAGRGGR